MFRQLSRKHIAKGLFTAAATVAIASGIGVPQIKTRGNTTAHTTQINWNQVQASAQSSERTTDSSPTLPTAYYSELHILCAFVFAICLVAWAARLEPRHYQKHLKNKISPTTTQFQVAVKVADGGVQQSLIHAETEIDWTCHPEKWKEALEDSVRLLSSFSERCTHVNNLSHTFFTLEKAGEYFQVLSMMEHHRSEREYLTDESDNTRLQDAKTVASTRVVKRRIGIIEDEILARTQEDKYIVVTLLLGTAAAYPPMFDIVSTEDLSRQLAQLVGLTPSHLLKYELIWSPQDPQETLTYADLSAKYPNLSPIKESAVCIG